MRVGVAGAGWAPAKQLWSKRLLPAAARQRLQLAVVTTDIYTQEECPGSHTRLVPTG